MTYDNWRCYDWYKDIQYPLRIQQNKYRVSLKFLNKLENVFLTVKIM